MCEREREREREREYDIIKIGRHDDLYLTRSYLYAIQVSNLQKSTFPGILHDPAPQVMVFIPHTRVLTIPRQSETERGMGWVRDAPVI